MSEFPKKGSSGGGSTPCYSVETRWNYPEPKQFGDVIYHKEWKRITFDRAKVGVPNGMLCRQSDDMGLLSYSAAQALRWWFHAETKHDFCFETRIVKHLVTHEYKEELVGAFDYVGGENGKSFYRPDEVKP